MKGLTFTVVDLNLSDGIDAGYTPLPDPNSFAWASGDVRNRAGVWSDFTTHCCGFPVPVQMRQNDWVAASIDAAGNAVATARLEGRHETASAYFGISTYSEPERQFLLAPYTQLSVSVEVWITLDDAGAISSRSYSNYGSVFLAGAMAEGSWTMADAYLFAQRDGTPSRQHLSERLTVTFTNDMPAYTELGLQINGGLLLEAIPEPSTYALFGLGLSCMGLLARRRRPRPSSSTRVPLPPDPALPA
ncbi:PEP-CTERM sorting domain-containing protein [Eleftheria terrae]|uniref:PEP-CTERM sorting domain-containing protein n=1 Tax=Eleftheria terrae TaxID=1597781 RepID=UPI00263B6A44|nr:PEP-CTERM sorting domain-containing protein [Eleftheria terrae]WKB55384.1 PEP-CTERM sorting domain-containing protein [Eleftheria terrae]